MIEDPFDKTYNPARVVKTGKPLEEAYLNFIKTTFDSLINTGELIAFKVKEKKEKVSKNQN